MGNILALVTNIDEEVKLITQENELMTCKLEMMAERMGRLERDIINTNVRLNNSREEIKILSNRMLSIDLLDEGRSMIGRRVSHTASSYK